MAVTVSQLARRKFGNGFETVNNVTLDDSYPTNGEPLTAAQLGLTVIDAVLATPAGGYLFEYDYANSKLKAYTPVKVQAAHAHNNTLTVTDGGLTSYSQADIKGSANTDSENVDAAAAPTNGAAVAAYTAISTTWTVNGTITNPDVGRNVCITIQNDTGGPLNLFEGVMTFTVTGTWRGSAQTDTITFTSGAGDKAVATTKFRYKYGTVPFDTVTDITLDNVADNGLKIGAGLGSKIGLPTDLKTPAEADVTKVTVSAADYGFSGKVDTTNMTVNLGALSDNDDFAIVYATSAEITDVSISNASGGAISAAAASEVASGSNLSSVTVRLIAIGI